MIYEDIAPCPHFSKAYKSSRISFFEKVEMLGLGVALLLGNTKYCLKTIIPMESPHNSQTCVCVCVWACLCGL